MAFHTSAFTPSFGSGSVLTPAATSAQVNLPDTNSQTICLTNLGTNVCYVRLGASGTVTATTADYPVPPYAQVVLTKSPDQKILAHISALGTSLHVIIGSGF